VRGRQGAAEDLLQDVLERMYPKWRRLKGNPEAYARAALANASANRWRTKSRRVHETPLTQARTQSVSGPEKEVVDRDEVVRALGRLPERMRVVVVLRFFDLSEADTAAALGCSVGTVKSQTSRGGHNARRPRDCDAAVGDVPHGPARDHYRACGR
jgi:RNA polymerase sigma factor (sigma-70 family)